MADFPLWQHGERREHPPLRGACSADVAVVGGGLTGAFCTLALAESGARVTLLESDRFGRGASWCCTGKVTAQLGDVYATAAQTVGLRAAAEHAALLLQSVEEVASLIQRLRLPCRAERHSVYVFARTEADVPALQRLTRLQRSLGLPVRQAPDAGGCPFPVALASVLEGQLLVQPLPLLLGLLQRSEALGATLHEHTPVREIDGRRLITPGGSLRAEHVILATGSPLGCTSLPRLAMLQQRTCETCVLRHPLPLRHSFVSVHGDGLTLRPCPEGAVLAWDLGCTGDASHPRRQEALRHTLRRLLPEAQVLERSIRQDVWSGDGLPLIGPVHPAQPHVLMATGYSGWGVATAQLAAALLAGSILGRPHPQAGLYRPDRRYPGHGRVLLQEGLRTGRAYAAGLVRRSAPTCPHMGGRLRYNPDAARWECPCHGSTFTVMGEPLDAPAAQPASVSARQR